jgi:DME family drug/metabolite transporter
MVMFASVLWGTGNVVARSIYDVASTNPTSVAFFRMALSVPALAFVCLLTLGRQAFAIHKRDLPFMLVAGTLVALYQASFYASLPRVGVAIATVIALASAPVIVAVLSAAITRERPSAIVIFALACATVGTVLLTNGPATPQQTDVLGGVGFALLAGLLYAINTLVGRRLGAAGRAHPLQTTTIGFGFGAVVLLVIALASGFVVNYPIDGWVRLAYLGLVPTALGYALFYAGMRTTSAASASIATLMEPLTSTVIAVSVLREPLSPQAFIGAVLMVIAMVVLVVGRR